jgi:PncC family amidohydrolase
MKSDHIEELNSLSKKIVESLAEKKLKISFAESITGGLFVSSLTKISGASKVLSESFITYSEEAKTEILSVSPELLKSSGVYSLVVAEAMLQGLSKISSAAVLLAVSGIAGPDAPENHSVGEVYMSIRVIDKTLSFKKTFSGTREDIQMQTAIFGFTKILELLR